MYVASKNSYTNLAYNAIDIGSGLASTGAGVKNMMDHAKNGGRVVDMTYDTLQAKKVLRETINVSDDLSILGQRGKSAYVVLDKSVDSKTALDYTGTVIGAGQAIDWLADKLFH